LLILLAKSTELAFNDVLMNNRTTQFRYSEKQRNEILEMSRCGIFVLDIAQKFGGEASAIWALINKSGEAGEIRRNYLRIRSEDRIIRRVFREENRSAIKAWKIIESAWNLRECIVCGDIFTTGANGFVCSQKCHGVRYRSENPDSSRRAVDKQLKKGKLERIQSRESRKEWFKNNPRLCKECGQPISAEKRAVCDSAVFCSRLCHGRNRSRRPEYIAIKKAIYIRVRDSGKTNKQKADYYFTNVSAKIAKNLRNRLRFAIIRAGGRKSADTESLTGCGGAELVAWLKAKFQTGMTMENYGSYWHVDHAISCESFDLTKPEEQRKCFHYTNLQPLEGGENISKGKNCWSVVPTLAANAHEALSC